MVKKNLRIYQQIILIQIISILAIMVLFGVVMYSANYGREAQRLSEQADRIAKRLSSNLSLPIWNLDDDLVKNLLTQDVQDPYLFCLIIFQGGTLWQGKIKLETGAPGKFNVVEFDQGAHGSLLSKKFAEKTEKIVYRDPTGTSQELGELHLYLSDRPVADALGALLLQTILQALSLVVLLSALIFIVLHFFLDRPLQQITGTARRIADGEVGIEAAVAGPREIATLAQAFNRMTGELRSKAEGFRQTNGILTEIIQKAKEIVINLNSASREIEAAAQEQTSGMNELASGITEVSATLEELSITAKQITKNVGELVFSSEEAIKNLQGSEGRLVETAGQLGAVGEISRRNSGEIGELGKRSVIINEMVEFIKEIANKTNILSINASIEASRSGEAGSGFAVVAAEIRELSKETIASAKNVEKAAREIKQFIDSIVLSSENESAKVVESGRTVKAIQDNVGGAVEKIGSNYSFTQKIDVSIKQQENGSKQAADTMRQMAEISRQSAGTARQTLQVVKEIVALASSLNQTIAKFNLREC